VLRAAQLANVLEPGSLVVPVKAGRPTFKLEALASANGFSGHATHDALGDVRATAHVLRTIAARAPATWELLSGLADKKAACELLRDPGFVLVVEHFGVAVTRPVVPICPNPDYPTEWLGLDVSVDPAPLLGLSPEELARAFADHKRRLCRIRTNAMPLVVSADHPAATRLLAANIAADVPARTRHLRTDSGFAERLIRAAALSRREYPKAIYVEDQLYEEGFFPWRADEGLVGAFHAADPADKLAIVDAMQAERARQLGRRIVYNEFPEVLSVQVRSMMDQSRIARLRNSDAPWTSIGKALAEIDKLMPTATPSIAKILDEYRRYLRDLLSAQAA
jgi:exodeoxyribonuclease-1